MSEENFEFFTKNNDFIHWRYITLGDLKLGLVCVTNLGEKPDFLDMACLAKPRNSQFIGQKSSLNFRSPSV